MTTAADVSVVVPFFGSERHIAECIESLLGQKGFEGTYEIILVDNDSADGSRSILERYDGLTILDEPTPGAYAARNTGIRHAGAPLLAFTDADCVVAADWLRSIQEAMREPATAMVVGRVLYPDAASLTLRWLGAYESAKANHVINHCAAENHFAYGNNMAVRASLFEELGPFEEWKRAGDTEMVHRMAAHRPDLRLVYDPGMRVTHLEFTSTRDRLRRLRLYRSTNSRVSDFRELDIGRRIGILMTLLGIGRRR